MTNKTAARHSSGQTDPADAPKPDRMALVQLANLRVVVYEGNPLINFQPVGIQWFYYVKGKLTSLTERLVKVSLHSPWMVDLPYKQVARRLEQIRPNYPASCTLYAVERGEFDRRKVAIQPPPTESYKKSPYSRGFFYSGLFFIRKSAN